MLSVIEPFEFHAISVCESYEKQYRTTLWCKGSSWDFLHIVTTQLSSEYVPVTMYWTERCDIEGKHNGGRSHMYRSLNEVECKSAELRQLVMAYIIQQEMLGWSGGINVDITFMPDAIDAYKHQIRQNYVAEHGSEEFIQSQDGTLTTTSGNVIPSVLQKPK